MPKLGDVSTLAINPPIKGMTSSIVAFVRTASGFAALRGDDQLQTFDSSGKPLAAKRTSSGGMLATSALVASPDGGAVLTGTTKITQYDAATAKPGLQYKGHGGKTEVTGLAFLSDGRLASSALVNIANTKANSVCIWAEDGALLHTIHLPSGRPKDPCQPQRMVRAGATDALIAVGWAPSDGTAAVVPALHLFRIDPHAQAVTRIATLWDGTPLTYTSVESIAATDDRVILALHSRVDAASRDPKERSVTSEIRVLDLEGNTIASDVSGPTVGGYAPSHRAVAVSADGSMLATVFSGMQLRAFPSLEVLDSIEDLPLDTVPRFEDGALLYATTEGIFRAPIA